MKYENFNRKDAKAPGKHILQLRLGAFAVKN
jgi:hypothetical protein